MEKELLNLIPKRFLCPYCGEWHDCDSVNELGFYDAFNHQMTLNCPNIQSYGNKGCYRIYFYGDDLNYWVKEICGRAEQRMIGTVPIDSIIENSYKSIVTFSVPFTSYSQVGRDICRECYYVEYCNFAKLGNKGDNRHMTIKFGFEFEQSDYEKFAKTAILARKESELQERENAVKGKEQSLHERESVLRSKQQELEQQQRAEEIARQLKNRENTIMAKATTKKTSIKSQLYERSPKENFEIVKVWAEKYKPVLRWAIPVAAVYGAYRILNSNEFDLSVNNIADTCEKQLGFKVKFLENKRALKELMVIGGLSAGAYGAVKAVSGIFGAKEEKDIFVEDVEAGMNQLESISKKFAWIQPKTEEMLPIAFSVILVYVTLHKPKFTGKVANKVRDLTEDFKVRLDTYVEMAKLFINDKFNIDLSNEEEQKKLKICAFLVALIGIFVFLYGKKALGDTAKTEETGVAKEENVSKSVEVFVEQAKAIIQKIAPTIYTTLITLLVSKKILMLEESLEPSDGNEESVGVDDKEPAVEPGNPAEES